MCDSGESPCPCEECQAADRNRRAGVKCVGDHLHDLIAQLGVQPDASCGCEAMRQRMNAWGPEGCREHKAEIVEHLQAAYKSTDWLTVLRAASLAAAQGIWSLEGLVEVAVERAEQT